MRKNLTLLIAGILLLANGGRGPGQAVTVALLVLLGSNARHGPAQTIASWQ